MENRTINKAVVAEVAGALKELKKHSEVLMAHIHPLMLEERLPIVEEKIFQILEAQP